MSLNDTISVVLPTFMRERELVDTIAALLPRLRFDDELIVIDQTPIHDQETDRYLHDTVADCRVRWYRRAVPSQCEAMNIGALLARGGILLFLDDDIIPSVDLLEAHRHALSSVDPPPATGGQVLQPWNREPVDTVNGFDLEFDFAYAKGAQIRTLIGANFAIRRDVFLSIGGMDENFRGSNYRNDAEMAYRICSLTGRRISFIPEAGIRHLLADGGNRAFGAKDTWGHIGGSIGDYYFAWKWLGFAKASRHSVARIFRASLNRNTVKHPWLLPSMFLREAVALVRGVARLKMHPHVRLRAIGEYGPLIKVAGRE